MMLENVLLAAPPGDNARGAAACPSWLFVLDRLDPGRVLHVGAPARAEEAWLRDHATELRVVTGASLVGRSGGDPLPTAHFDVVHLGQDAAAVVADHRALSRLRAATAPDAQLWCPAVDRPTGERALRGAGFPRVRWIETVATAADLMVTSADDDPSTSRFLPGPKRRGRGSRVVSSLRSSVPGGSPSRAGRRRGTGPVGAVAGGGPASDGPPAYVADIAREAGTDLGGYRWSVWSRGAYPSQKAVVFLFPPGATTPGIVVKVTKDRRFNARLDNEHAALGELAGAAGAVRAPRPCFHGRSGGLAVLGQEAVAGRPFTEASDLSASCRLAADAVAFITALGTATAAPVPASRVAEPLAEVLERFVRLYGPSPPARAFLERQVATIGRRDQLPGVLFHGDLGCWNAMVGEDGHVSVLDWEAAERPGPPLWDLAYFLRSYAVQTGRSRRGLDRRRRSLDRHLLTGSPLTSVAGEWFRRYRDAVGLDRDLLAPLFHTCWMHRAVKEATRLPAGHRGHYAELCLRLVDRHDAPGLRVLLGGDAGD